MAEENVPMRTVSGEVLPAERRDVQLPPNTPAGIPFLAQAKYWAARRALESYTRALAAQTAALRELEARERALQGFERALVQSEHLPDLRRIEELKIINELSALIEDSEVRAFQTRSRKAQAEAEAIDAERRLKAMKDRSMAEPESQPSAAEQARIKITQLRADAEAIKKSLVDCYGGDEDKLTQDDRDLLTQVDVALRNKILELLEKF